MEDLKYGKVLDAVEIGGEIYILPRGSLYAAGQGVARWSQSALRSMANIIIGEGGGILKNRGRDESGAVHISRKTRDAPESARVAAPSQNCPACYYRLDDHRPTGGLAHVWPAANCAYTQEDLR